MAFTLVSSDNTGAYTTANALSTPECWLVDIAVSGGNLSYQLQYYDPTSSGPALGIWLPESGLLVPSSGVVYASLWRRCTGFRFRSSTAGTNVVVVATLVPPNELPPQNEDNPTQRRGGTYPAGTGYRP